MANKVVDFEDNSKDFELPLLAELENKIVVLKEVRFGTSTYGKYGVITLNIEGDKDTEDKLYRSGGAAIINQLAHMEENIFSKSEWVRAKIIKPEGKKYFVFMTPKE